MSAHISARGEEGCVRASLSNSWSIEVFAIRNQSASGRITSRRANLYKVIRHEEGGEERDIVDGQ